MKFNFNLQTACVSCFIAIILSISVNTDANVFQALPFQRNQGQTIAVETIDSSKKEQATNQKKTVSRSLMVKPIMSETTASSENLPQQSAAKKVIVTKTTDSTAFVEQTETTVQADVENKNEPANSAGNQLEGNQTEETVSSETTTSSSDSTSSSDTGISSTEETSSSTSESSTESTSINADASISTVGSAVN